MFDNIIKILNICLHTSNGMQIYAFNIIYKSTQKKGIDIFFCFRNYKHYIAAFFVQDNEMFLTFRIIIF